ncbi:MAG: ABC transporter ATP-binding protein [Bacillota bacterium]
MAVFVLEDVTYWYPMSREPALRRINLAINQGELLLVLGRSGSGKSSLARLLAGLIPRFYGGRLEGKALFHGKDLTQVDPRTFARSVGIVFQDPERQLLATSVEWEIALGLENLVLHQQEILRRVAETVEFFELDPFEGQLTPSLSGGYKQKLVLASVMAMGPQVLILDEPTSQLSPREAEELLGFVERLNREMGCTVVLIEQRVERCFHLADRVAFMEKGGIAAWGNPQQMATWIARNCPEFAPPVARFFVSLGIEPAPLTISQGRKVLAELVEKGQVTWRHSNSESCPAKPGKGMCLARLEHVWFAYHGGPAVLKDCNFQVYEGEFTAIVGENAAGKTTLLKNLVGRLKPTRGRGLIMGKDTRSMRVANLAEGVAHLSQDPSPYIFQNTVENELKFTLSSIGLRDDGVVNEVLTRLGLTHCRLANPRELSSGERQRVALASLLVGKPRLLVLDEPTRGLDPCLKHELGQVLKAIAAEGGAVVLVTHDVEFAAEHAQSAALMHRGRIVCQGDVREVLGKSMFYCPQIPRLLKGYCDDAITLREAMNSVARRW